MWDWRKICRNFRYVKDSVIPRSVIARFDCISEKLGVSPTLDPFLGMCRTLRANLRILALLITS